MFRAAVTSEKYESRFSRAQESEVFRSFLRSDFVGPVAAGWLFSDFASIFIPIAGFPDRSAAIEQSWEKAWRSAAQSNRFAEDFRKLWPAVAPQASNADLFPQGRWPHLILNSASITKGIVTATADVTGLTPAREAFPKVTEITPLRFRTSTAVNNSARFPVIQPPGMVLVDPEFFRAFGLPEPRQSAFFDYVVDGGYVDNFGSYALLGIMDQIREFNCSIVRRAQTAPSRPVDLTGCDHYRREPGVAGIVPIVIQITSDPDLVRTSMDSCGCLDAPTAWKVVPPGIKLRNDLDYFTEVAAPANMMDQMRQMNGIYSAIALAERNDVEAYFHFGIGPPYPPTGTLQRPEPPASLNWVLSRRSMRQLDEQLQQCERLQVQMLGTMIANPGDVRRLNGVRRVQTISRAASVAPTANRLFCK